MAGSNQFNPDTDIPDLSGKVIVVTGGNAGLGKETIINLAKHNPQQIWMAARSQSKAETAIREIQEAVPGAPVTHLPLDLASFASISEAAKKFKSSSSRLDVLINNAGIMAVPNGKTVDGVEIQMGTNVLGPFLLTKLLMPTLQSTAKQPGADVRIVNLSSEAHRMRAIGDVATDDSELMKLGPWVAYSNSKLGDIILARECAKRYPEITSVAVHPGIIAGTTLWDNFKNSGIFDSVATKVSNMLFSTIEDGAKNQLWAATCKKEDIKSGQYYVPVGKASSGSWKASSTKQDTALWEWAENKIKEKGY